MPETIQRNHDTEADDEPVSRPELRRTEIYDVLSNERRTWVLELLQEREPRELSTLAEVIATKETGEDPPPRDKRSSVYVTLHQSHLPKLDSLGIVDYNKHQKILTLGDRATDVLGEWDETDAVEDDTPAGHATVAPTVAAAGVVLASASVAGVPVVATVPPVLLAIATLSIVFFLHVVPIVLESD